MFKTGIQGILNKSRSILTKSFGTETQRVLADMIYDDDVEVLTTFDMNRIATLTFGDEVCGEIFDVLEYTLRHPIEFTVLTLHKTLVLIRHLAIYASQKAANATWILKPHIKPLIEYNTVLLALDNPTSILGRVQRIKGGSVDKGQPVRDAARGLFDLVNDVQTFKTIRSQSEDPDSLVPVGHKEEVGFVSDEVRKAILDEKIQKQHAMQVKSNLKTPNDAIFGAGYVGKDGKTVVGAAHGLEEMLKMAEKSNKRYSDNNTQQTKQQLQEKEHLDKLKMEVQIGKIQSVNSLDSKGDKRESKSGGGNDNNAVVDLLDFGNDDSNNAVQSNINLHLSYNHTTIPDLTDSDILSRGNAQPMSNPTVEEPEIVESPSLPYPYTKEESFVIPEENEANQNELGKDTQNQTLVNTGGIFGGIPINGSERASSMTSKVESDPHQDLLNLSTPSFPPPTSNTLQDSMTAMGNLSLNSNPMNNSTSVFDSSSNSVFDVIPDAMPSTQNAPKGDVFNPMNNSISSTNDIMGSGGDNRGSIGAMGIMGNIENTKQTIASASSAISAMDMLPPMGDSSNTSNIENQRPPTPVDSPPPLPPVSPPAEPRSSPIPMGGYTEPPPLPPVSPPAEPRSTPIPMGGYAQPPQTLPPVSPPAEPRSSPIPMGGYAKPSPPPPPPASNNAFANNMMMPDSSANAGNMMNPMNQQQEMMMMLMNQQQQLMMQQTNNGGGMNNNNNQQAMMQQMMMMNQQMMQLMSMQNPSVQQQSQQPQSQQPSPLQQQQQMMSMMMQQQTNMANGNSQENSTNSGGYPDSMNPFS